MTYQSPAPEHGITATGMYVVTEKMLQKIELESGVLLDSLRSRPAQQQPDALAEAYRMIESLIYSDCPPEDMCDPVCEKSCTECKEHALARLRSGRK